MWISLLILQFHKVLEKLSSNMGQHFSYFWRLFVILILLGLFSKMYVFKLNF